MGLMQNGSGGRDNDYDDECAAWHAMTMVMVMVVLTMWLVMYVCFLGRSYGRLHVVKTFIRL